MGLDLPSGGHLTHGFYTLDKKTSTRKAVSATSVYFESFPYKVDDNTGLIDYAELRKNAGVFKPALIVAGGSAYARDWDYKTYRDICDENGSLMLVDMAHISGLVACGECNNPFEYADVVTTTCHKSLRGPRAGMIFYRKDERDFDTRIKNAVFPALQGGPHEHQIAGIATQLKEVMTPEFKAYIVEVKANAAALAARLMKHGYVAWNAAATPTTARTTSRTAAPPRLRFCLITTTTPPPPLLLTTHAPLSQVQARDGRHREPPHPVGPAPQQAHGLEDAGDRRRRGHHLQQKRRPRRPLGHVPRRRAHRVPGAHHSRPQRGRL